jgi:tetratricopeptide (TPR) repeat protein
MAKLARLPAVDRAARADADVSHVPRLRTRFYAFLSYSHKDKILADWLHRELERFRVPHSLAGRLTANGVVPRRLTPIFRDQHDLSAGGDLAEEIKAALAASQFLIVLCSPTAAKSRWTNQEIESFKRTRPEGCVLAAVVSGEPFASDIPGREAEECFPPALRYKYDRRGHQTAKRADPLAADFREAGEGQRLAFLKLVAGMLGVGLDELVQRDTTRRHRQLAWLAAASLGGMAVTSTLAVTAIQARNEAREQRREAEGLVGFMLGDLKDKLEPIGRLDALDGVGSRVLAYYQKQGTADLTDAALSQRSRALTLMAQVAQSRGDVEGALRLYREAMAGTAESVRRDPNNPQALFDHAQNVFYVGEIAHNRGDYATAEARMREYQRLALRMIALGPDSMKWRMEKQYADTNLGVILFDQRRFPEAVRQFRDALSTMKAIATADSANKDYQASVAESLAWLADAEHATGNYGGAIAARQEGIAVLERLLAATNDVNYQQKLIPAHRALGALYAEQGERGPAVQQFNAAVDEAERLIPKEPNNAVWVDYGATARAALARQLLLAGQVDQAAAQTVAVCGAAQRLLRKDAQNAAWRGTLSTCWALQAKVALARGDSAGGLTFAQRALDAARSVHSGDAVADAYLTAGVYRLLGDVEQRAGDGDAARESWNAAFRHLPPRTAEEPSQAAERAEILRRLGREGESRQIASRLNAIGYREAS